MSEVLGKIIVFSGNVDRLIIYPFYSTVILQKFHIFIEVFHRLGSYFLYLFFSRCGMLISWL